MIGRQGPAQCFASPPSCIVAGPNGQLTHCPKAAVSRAPFPLCDHEKTQRGGRNRVVRRCSREAEGIDVYGTARRISDHRSPRQACLALVVLSRHRRRAARIRPRGSCIGRTRSSVLGRASRTCRKIRSCVFCRRACGYRWNCMIPVSSFASPVRRRESSNASRRLTRQIPQTVFRLFKQLQ